ncbi:MAG: hypothetical protein GXY75_07930 [Bacteroidales bacterium]|jgi:hypothetical protein|nr:hypothetical protein [Bacteroidales bacterium]
MNNPNEIFTYPLTNKSELAQKAINDYNCRFLNKMCDKQSRLINYPMGVCSVNHGESKPIICPNRFLEDNIVFINICKSAFGTTDNILLFKEVKLDDVGTFDFVLVKHRPISSQIEDFCIVEFQSDSTTGTGKLVIALEDFMANKDTNKSYGFGMNTYNTIKLSYIQMLIKGQVMESWNKKIFWVMQDFVYDNMVNRFNLVDLDYDEKDKTHYHIYDLVLNDENLYNLKLKERKSTTISNLIKAFTHQPTPSIDNFISKLEKKIELKLGIAFR